jgi:predicted PurR-regulated permease PerM
MQEVIPQTPDSRSIQGPTARQVVFATLAIVATAAVFFLIYQFRNILLILLAAIVLATALQPLIQRLEARKLGRTPSASIVYLLLVTILIVAGAFVVPLLIEQATAITGVAPQYYNQARSLFLDSPSWFVRRLGFQLPAQLPTLPGAATAAPAAAAPVTDEEMAARFNKMLVWGGVLLRTAFGVVTTFILAFYWTLEREIIIRGGVSLLPARRRRHAYARVSGLEAKLQVFLRAQGILCAVIGVASLIAYLIIGMPYALLLALLAGVMEAVPLIGPLLGAIPALLVAVSVNQSLVLGVLISTAVIQLLENNLLVPRIMSRAVGANEILTLVTFLVFSYLLGIPGGLLAVPVAVAIQWFADRKVEELDAPAELPEEQRDQAGVLRYQAQELVRDVRKQMRQDNDAASPVDDIGDAIEAVVDELDELLAGPDEGSNGA